MARGTLRVGCTVGFMDGSVCIEHSPLKRLIPSKTSDNFDTTRLAFRGSLLSLVVSKFHKQTSYMRPKSKHDLIPNMGGEEVSTT